MKFLTMKFAFIFPFLFVPFVADVYFLNFCIHTFIVIAYAASWNLMGGFCGQFSFGHALYAGVSGYLSAWLFLSFGVSPLLSLPFVVLVSSLLGGGIAYLAATFNLRQGYFTLLTISLLECGRIFFESWFCGGLFIPLKGSRWNLSLSEIEFYYLFLSIVVVFTGFTAFIYKSKFGYSSRALNNNIMGASAIGINTTKVQTQMMMLSTAFTGLTGVLSAFYNHSLFPEHMFGIDRSVGMLIPCFLGGLGTIFGPLIGGIGISVIGEVLDYIFSGFAWPGFKQVIFGAILLFLILKNKKGALRRL